MNHKKVANQNYEEHYTTSNFSRHGVGKSRRKLQNLRNRAAKRVVARDHFDTQDDEAQITDDMM